MPVINPVEAEVPVTAVAATGTSGVVAAQAWAICRRQVRARRIAHNRMAEVSLPTATEADDVCLTPAQADADLRFYRGR